jgi:hypothetical protein
VVRLLARLGHRNLLVAQVVVEAGQLVMAAHLALEDQVHQDKAITVEEHMLIPMAVVVAVEPVELAQHHHLAKQPLVVGVLVVLGLFGLSQEVIMQAVAVA